jgi:PAS domain S-box-containing protein
MSVSLVSPATLPWAGWFNRDLIENMPVAVYVCDADGVLVAYNKKAGILWGRTPTLGDTQQKFCGAHRLHLADGSYLPHDESPLAAILTTRQPISFDAIVGRPDGTLRNVAANLAPLFDDQMGFVGFVNCVLDVTDARRTAENRDRMWQLSLDLMVTATLTGTVTAANPAWHNQLGWSEESLIGVSVDTLVHQDDAGLFRDQWRACSQGKCSSTFETRLRRRDGGYSWLSWSAVSDGVYIHATARDVTREKDQAIALAAVEDALRQSQKMEAIGQLTGGVAHDFNNLLQVIRGSADILKLPGITEERRVRYIQSISNTADRAAKLTNQLLSFARRQALKPEVFDVGLGLGAVGEMVGTLTGSRIVTDFQFTPGQSWVHADAAQLDTAVVNMVVNARDAIDGAGTITISLSNVTAMPSIRAHAARIGDFVAIAVSDTGSGILPDDMARIFEPFFTTKGIGAGTGLGLSQVFGFAKQSGGEILVESQVGVGTTFTLYLPRHIGAAGTPSAQAAQVRQAPDGAGAVLVVEDNPDVGEFSRDLLIELGYAATLVTSAHACLARLSQEGAVYDVVFSDVEMPGMSGLELAARLKLSHPHLPVVLTSGFSHNLYEHGLPDNELLHKPYTVAQLEAVMRSKMDRTVH